MSVWLRKFAVSGPGVLARVVGVLLVGAAVLVSAGEVQAQDEDAADKSARSAASQPGAESKKASRKANRQKTLDDAGKKSNADRKGQYGQPEVGSRVEVFVRKHQPELAKLLEHIKQRSPAQYKMALRDLGKAITRLENLLKRDEELYAVELELWKIRSQLRIHAAQMSVNPAEDSGAEAKKLKSLVKQEQSQNLVRLKMQRKRAIEQVESLEEQIKRRTSLRDELLERSLKSWGNKIKKASLTKRPKR